MLLHIAFKNNLRWYPFSQKKPKEGFLRECLTLPCPWPLSAEQAPETRQERTRTGPYKPQSSCCYPTDFVSPGLWFFSRFKIQTTGAGNPALQVCGAIRSPRKTRDSPHHEGADQRLINKSMLLTVAASLDLYPRPLARGGSAGWAGQQRVTRSISEWFHTPRRGANAGRWGAEARAGVWGASTKLKEDRLRCPQRHRHHHTSNNRFLITSLPGGSAGVEPGAPSSARPPCLLAAPPPPRQVFPPAQVPAV